MVDEICYHCVKRLKYPKFAVSLIGADKKKFKKDYYGLCADCFEYFFGSNNIFTSKKDLAMSCHMCQSSIIISLPYSYFLHNGKFTDGSEYLRQKTNVL